MKWPRITYALENLIQVSLMKVIFQLLIELCFPAILDNGLTVFPLLSYLAPDKD